MAYRELTEVILQVRAYAKEFPNTKQPGLLLMGDPGTGKIFGGSGVPRQFWRRVLKALVLRLPESSRPDPFDRYNDSSSIPPISDKEAYRVAIEKDVLLLDDLGAHRVTDWVFDTVTSIITSRCNQKKPLIATTNLIDPEMGYITRVAISQEGKVMDYRTTLK